MTERNEPSNPHDALFTQVFGKPAVAAQFFQVVLPPSLRTAIDWGSLELEPDTFVDEKFRRTSSDLLFSAETGEGPALLYCLFEHQSTPDRMMPLRLQKYMSRIWWRACTDEGLAPGELPPIIPVVLSQGPRPWSAGTRFVDVLNVPKSLRPGITDYLLDFQYVLVDLSDWDADRFREEVLIQCILAIMKVVRQGSVNEVRETLYPLMSEVIRRGTATGILESVMYYVFVQGPEPLFTEMRRALKATRGSETEERTVTKLAQKFWKQGQIEAYQETILDALETRFNETSTEIREKVLSITDPDLLKKLFRAALESPSLEEFEIHL